MASSLPPHSTCQQNLKLSIFSYPNLSSWKGTIENHIIRLTDWHYKHEHKTQSCQAILRLPVSLVLYFSKNSVLFHVYTSESVCNISHFSEYVKAIQEPPYLSTIKLISCLQWYLQWYLSPGFSMYLQQKLPPSSHQRPILTWVIWISTPLFLRTVLWFFFSLVSRISFSTGLFQSAYKHALEWPAFFFSLTPPYFIYLSSNCFILDSS